MRVLDADKFGKTKELEVRAVQVDDIKLPPRVETAWFQILESTSLSRLCYQNDSTCTPYVEESASEFCDKVAQLNSIVKSVVDAVDQQAQRTESEKLRAVGKRNQAVAEAEIRKRKKAELQAMR